MLFIFFFTLMLKVKCILSAFSLSNTWILVPVQHNEDTLIGVLIEKRFGV